MYFNYYGLKEKPFSLSPDPRYLYYSHSHKEALAQMIYAAAEDAGFLILTGEVGTGKTIIINALLDRLPKEYRVAKIYHSALSPKGLIENICKEFNIDFSNSSISQLVLKVQDYLKWAHSSGDRSILILDEAQNLTRETLEEIRLLSNFEAAHKKILQIYLVGQPELEEKLWSKDLRQLRERVSLKYRLQKLDRGETSQYISKRLIVAGHTNGKPIFTKEAVDTIYRLSGGIPRRINILCENAMLSGYADNYKLIYERVIRKVAAYNQQGKGPSEVIEYQKKPNKMITAPESVSQNQSQVSTAINSGNNGTIDYAKFQDYMEKFLTENGIIFSQKAGPGKIFFWIVLGFLILILAFISAIFIAMQIGLFN